MHKNINENEPDDINESDKNENTVAYVSDIRVSTEGSYLRWLYIASRQMNILEILLKVQSYNNALAHKIKNIYGNITL